MFTLKNGFRVDRCSSCLSLFVANPPADLASIYTREYFWGASEGFGYVDYEADKAPMKDVFEKSLLRLEDLVSKKTLLDVGAATGYFLNLAKKRGWKVSGVEIGNAAAEKGRQDGYEIITGTIADIPPGKRFGVVTMFDVIEHMTDPKDSLKRVWQMLEADGVILIITPNSGSAYARLLGKRWHLIVPPEHLVLFNKDSLSNLLHSTGFKVLEIKSPGKSFTFLYVIHTLLRWQKLKIWSRLLDFAKRFPSIGNLRLPINLHDNMIIFARKES